MHTYEFMNVMYNIAATSKLYAKQDDIAVAVNENTNIKFLIPTLTGPGVSSTALTMLLVSAHNTLISSCLNSPFLKSPSTK